MAADNGSVRGTNQQASWKECIFSCEHFGGYTIDLEVNTNDTLITLASRAKAHLKNFLVVNNLRELVALCDGKHYHIHDHTIESLMATGDPVYICSHREDPPLEPPQDVIGSS